MADYFPGAIQIGGALPRHLAPALAEVITAASALAERTEAPEILRTVDDLLLAVDPESRALRLYNHEASYGCFSALEDWLREHGIAYDRQSHARYEFDGQAASFRLGIGLVERTATQDGAPTTPLDDLRPVRELLTAALAEPTTARVKSALDALEIATGPDVPPLEPFVLVD